MAKLGRVRPNQLAHDPSRYPKLAANHLDRLVLGEIRPTDLRDRLHHQHPRPGPVSPPKPLWTHRPGGPDWVPITPKGGPYSMPIHTHRSAQDHATKKARADSLEHERTGACDALMSTNVARQDY
jgi:hypothetical protein